MTPPTRLFQFYLIIFSLTQILHATPSSQLQVDSFLWGADVKYKLDGDMAYVCHAGLNAVRGHLPWSEVETEKGKFSIPQAYLAPISHARQLGLQPLIVLCYSNRFYDNGERPTSDEAIEAFARYCQFVAHQLKDKVRYYQVWNEWNGTTGFRRDAPRGTPQDYVRLLRVAYAKIKKEDPDAIVIGGGMGGTGLNEQWTQEALRLGMLEHLDALSFHPYCYGLKDTERLPEHGYEQALNDMTQVVKDHNNGQIKPFYITELGWPNREGGVGVSSETSANYLARAYLLTLTHPHIHGLWWYNWRNCGYNIKDVEDNFGLVYPDLTPKAPYFTFVNLGNFLGKNPRFIADKSPNPSVKILQFQLANKKEAYAIWSVDENSEWVLEYQKQGNHTPPDAQICALRYGFYTRAWKQDKNDSTLSLTATNSPLIIYTSLSKYHLILNQKIR